MSNEKDSSSFLSRWSTRKQQSAQRVTIEEAAQDTESELSESSDSAVLLSDELLQVDVPVSDLQPTESTLKGKLSAGHATVQPDENPAPVTQAPALLTDADMPSVESLTASSDISGFFSSGVSAALRRTALRHVFRQPSYNVRDGLDDYDDDYTTFEPLGDTVTSDMKFHAARRERARLESERLAEAQAQSELDLPENAGPASDSPATRDDESAGKFAEDELNADPENMLDEDTERHENAVATAEQESGQQADLSSEQLPDPDPDTDIPLNKTSRATASQPCEIPNE